VFNRSDQYFIEGNSECDEIFVAFYDREFENVRREGEKARTKKISKENAGDHKHEKLIFVSGSNWEKSGDKSKMGKRQCRGHFCSVFQEISDE
jgi:hypothetical protein